MYFLTISPVHNSGYYVGFPLSKVEMFTLKYVSLTEIIIEVTLTIGAKIDLAGIDAINFLHKMQLQVPVSK